MGVFRYIKARADSHGTNKMFTRKDNQRKKKVSESCIDEGFSALSCEEDTVQYSPTIRRSRTRNSYKNPVNDEQITWIERRMDQKPLSGKIGTMDSFFQQVG